MEIQELVLNNLQRFILHKLYQPTNQPTNQTNNQTLLTGDDRESVRSVVAAWHGDDDNDNCLQIKYLI